MGLGTPGGTRQFQAVSVLTWICMPRPSRGTAGRPPDRAADSSPPLPLPCEVASLVGSRWWEVASPQLAKQRPQSGRTERRRASHDPKSTKVPPLRAEGHFGGGDVLVWVVVVDVDGATQQRASCLAAGLLLLRKLRRPAILRSRWWLSRWWLTYRG